MIDFGTVRPGSTLYIPFATYDSNDPSASVTLTGLLTSDIEIYSNGSVTQRASDSGYALLDTDGIDFDGITGLHGFSIDLADNTTAGFYAAGNQYWVVVASVTVDAATINFIAATFRIGYADAVINTTIASLTNQTSFTLTAGPAEDDALNGCVVMIHDVASAVQCGFAVISDYTGASKTVTLTAGTTFTAAATDNIAIFPPANTAWGGGVAWASGAITAAVIADNAIDAGAIASDAIAAAKIATGAITAAKFAAGAIDAAAIANGAIDAATFAADVDAEILSYLVDDATRIDASQLNTHSAITVAAIADQVWEEAIADHSGTAGSTAEALNAAGAAGDPWVTALPGAYGAGSAGKIVGDNLNATVSSRATQTSVDAIDDLLDTEMPALTTEVGKIPKSDGTSSWNATALAAIQSEANDALVAYDPPTKAELDTAQGVITALLPSALVGGRMDASVGAMAANVLTAAATAADFGTEVATAVWASATRTLSALGFTLGASDLAADTIGASELAADAITEIVNAVLTTAMTESYNADGAAPTLAQAMFVTMQRLTEFAISGTTITVKKLDGSTTAYTLTLDDATNPTSSTRAT